VDELLELEDDSGYDAADLYEFCLEQVALILAEDPLFGDWLEYERETSWLH